MRVLFVMNTPKYVRFFDETIQLLLGRGHDVHVGFVNARVLSEQIDVLRRGERQPKILGTVPARSDRVATAARELREIADFARYLDPRFAKATWLRDRRRLNLEWWAPARLIARADTLPTPLAHALVRSLLAMEDAIPSAANLEAKLRKLNPDVVVVSPLVAGASPQTDYVKSARALGIPTAVAVASWDNLTNKGLMRIMPDRVIVWNEAMVREAVELHGVDPERVAVAGAQAFDRWFGREPATTREEFCRRVGLDPDRPYVLFVGSTTNVADSSAEDRFVREWALALRHAADSELAGAGLLVRPHPERAHAWDTIDLDGIENATLWPPERPNPTTPAARGEYFDSLYHAAAIVGINTSAMVEATIVDRPVFTVRARQFEQAHEGTLHFAHLLPENGGFLHVAGDLGEHTRQLAGALADPAPWRERNATFVTSFLRPHGVERMASEAVVEAIEATAGLDADPLPAGPGVAARRIVLHAFALARWRHSAFRLAQLRRRSRRRDAALARLAAQLRSAGLPGYDHVRRLRHHLRRRAAVKENKLKQHRYGLKVVRARQAKEYRRRAGMLQ